MIAVDSADSPECLEWRWQHGGQRAARFLTLLNALRNGASPETLEGLGWDCLASIDSDPHQPRADVPLWLTRVAERIDDEFARVVLVKDLARDAGVHPVFLARIFRRHFGTSITERLSVRRLECAATELGRAFAKLPLVALESGFSDQSHLTRTFKKATGLTPGVFHRIASDPA